MPDCSRTELASYIDQLIVQKALARSNDGHDSIYLAEHGIAAMKAEHPVSLMRPLGTRAMKQEAHRVRSTQSEVRPLTPDERDLFERMRALRKRIAGEQNIPPYIVFSDATLRELARNRPSTPQEMLEVKGVGKAKLEAFADDFLSVIRASG